MKKVLLLLIFACTSCAPRGPAPFRQQQEVNSIVHADVRRTESFNALVGRGAIEFSWTDEKGNHKEQGELDFWKQGNQISLRISKLGELLAWFGGEGTDFWFFDFTGDESTLSIGGEQGLFDDVEVALVLLGVQPIQHAETNVLSGDALVTVDSKGRTWKTRVGDSQKIESVSMSFGEHEVHALNRDWIRVEQENKHELYWPETPSIIDITDNQNDTSIKIAFSMLSTIVADEPMDRVFDVELLAKALRPDSVVRGE